MSSSAAHHYDVRWRVAGTLAWSLPKSVSPVDEIVVEGLDREQDYEFEVRAVSACGAVSEWVPSEYTVPGAPANTLTLAELKSLADGADTAADLALAELDDMASDGKLTANEKLRAKRDYLTITGEQAGIDAAANSYGVTAEKAVYDTSVAALKTYLRNVVGVLNASYQWTGITGTTAITRSDWDTYWSAVYTSRQALLNAIYGVAKATADAAADIASQAGIINGRFDAGSRSGWDLGGGWVISSSHEISPMSGAYFMTFYAPPGSGTYYARNRGRLPIKAGSVVKAVAYYRNRYCSAVARLRVEWRGLDDALIDSTTVALAASGTGDSGWIFAQHTPAAPAGSYFANLAISVAGYDGGGAWHIDNCDLTRLADSADDVPESNARKWASESGADRTGRNINYGINVIVNPGAETGELYPHAVVDAGGSWSVGNLDGRLHSGAQAFLFNYAGQNGTAKIYFNAVDSIYNLSHQPEAKEGSRWRFTGYLYDWGTGAGGSVLCGITFRDAAGVSVGSDSVSLRPSGTVAYPFEVLGVAPAGTVYATASIWVEDDSEHDGYLIIDDVELRKADVSDPGSGVTLGNQLNAPNSLTLNYGIARSTTAISATSAGTVSINAFTYYMGTASVSYSAVSNAVTGLTQNSTYYIWCHDPGGKGGAKTWHATTNPNVLLQAYDDIVVAGQVTIPSSGTSSGGGGGVSCPHVNEPVIRRGRGGAPETVCAGAVRAGDFILSPRGHWLLVTYSEPSLQPCVKVTLGGGEARIFSGSAPLETAEGGSVLARWAEGRDLYHHAAGSMRVASVRRAGEQWVQHITAENDYFLVGNFSHHNAKPPL